jgi:uncharacterized protein
MGNVAELTPNTESSTTAAASAVSVFRPAPNAEGFDAFVPDLLASAEKADGFVAARVSVHNDVRLDGAVEVTFRTENLLHAWLDSPARKELLRDGESRGYWQRSSDLVFVDGGQPPVGVGVVMHSVAPGKEHEFLAAQVRIAEATAAFPGSEGTIVFPPDSSGEWMSVIRFRRGHLLSAWMQSRERAEALPVVRASLTRNFSEVSRTAPFGSTVRIQDGQTKITPGWKMAMLVLLTLYPTVMLLSRFLAPSLDHHGVPPWLLLFISNIASVAMLQWLLTPVASIVFRRWLDPIDGAGVRVSVIGAAAVVLLYGACLIVFASVKFLQFWHYAS